MCWMPDIDQLLDQLDAACFSVKLDFLKGMLVDSRDSPVKGKKAFTLSIWFTPHFDLSFWEYEALVTFQ